MDGRTAKWYQVDDVWVVRLECPDAVYEYPYSDFQDVLDVVAEWIQDGVLPG
jgi:hypothetical protein